VRLLVSSSIYAKKDGNGPPSANQVFSTAEPRLNNGLAQLSPDAAMLFAPFGCTNPSRLIPPFLLKQNLSSMDTDIAGSDIMKLKVS